MPIIKQFHTPAGIVERELTEAEIKDWAKGGDYECRLELFKREKAKGKADKDKVKDIEKFLTGEVFWV